MSEYTLHIRASPTGGDLIRCHNRIDALSFAYDKHGCAELAADLRIPREVAYQLYDRPALPHVAVCYAGAVIWAGRLNDATINRQVLRLGAKGYWEALRDNPFTGLWSTTSVAEWRPLTTAEKSDAYPDRYTFDTNNRISITANKGATLGTTTIAKLGRMAYIAHDAGERLITNISFDYSFSSQVNWLAAISSNDTSWGGGSTLWSLAGAGAGTVTGSQSLTLGTPRDRVSFYLYYNAADAVVAAETGDIFLRITNVRITTIAAPVLGSDIASAMVTYANTITAQLATAAVTASSLDLRDEQYDDMYPADIIDRVANIDGARAYVDEQRVFWYGQTATGRWLLDATEIEVNRSLDRVFNRAYGVYQDASGRTLRTADADDTFSQARYGVIRSTPVDATSTSSTQVGTQRDAALVDTANPPPRSQITVRRVLDSLGRPTLLHLPRPGDTAILPSLPPTLTSDVDQIRSFVIGRVAVALARGQPASVTIEPEEPVPTLTTMLARTDAIYQQVTRTIGPALGPVWFDGPRFDPVPWGD